MSCKHGNHESGCDLCNAEEEIWQIVKAKNVEIDDLKAACESLFKENAARRAALDAQQAAKSAHGCQGPECRDGILHKSDCAVHNGDALPVGPCDCGAANSAAPAAVYLVATGETVDGAETYTRHEGTPPPLCDFERLYTAPMPATQAPAAVGLIYQLRAPLSADWQDTPKPPHMTDDGYGAWYEVPEATYRRLSQAGTHKHRVLCDALAAPAGAAGQDAVVAFKLGRELESAITEMQIAGDRITDSDSPLSFRVRKLSDQAGPLLAALAAQGNGGTTA